MNRTRMLTELGEVLNASPGFSDWSELTRLGYLSEGQDKFCEDTGFFKDRSNFSITLQTGVAVYDVPDRIIQILEIWDGTRKLVQMPTGSTADVYALYQGLEGPPERWDVDQETGALVFYPIPTATYEGVQLSLRVWRYSLYDLAGDGPVPEGGGTAPDAAPELPSRLQRACIEWAAYKCFNHHDSETQDPVKAADHLASYKEYVRDGILLARRMHGQETRVGSNPAYRT